MSHIVKDLDDLITKLSRAKVYEGDRLYKCDIKEFFMSGKHKDLEEASSGKSVPSDRREVFEELTSFVLGAQYFRCPRTKRGKAHRVVRGSGMGLICSGEVSDATFDEQCEKNFLLIENVRKLFDIRCYIGSMMTS